MRRWALLAACLAAIVLGAGGTSSLSGCPPADWAADPRDNSSIGGCVACRLRAEVKKYSLDAIKEHVLAKLGFTHAPNTTGRRLPKTPADLLAKYEKSKEMEMQADQPERYSYYVDEDDFHARTEKVYAFPRNTAPASMTNNLKSIASEIK